jgi:hypothetical protein
MSTIKANIPISSQIVTDQNNLFTPAWFTFFNNLYKAVRASLGLELIGLYTVNSSSISNSGSTATNLLSFSLQTNTMVNNGDILEIKGFGTFGSNSNSKTITITFGTQTIYSAVSTSNGNAWSIKITIIRLTASTQTILVESLLNNSIAATTVAGTQDLTGALTIQFTGTGVSSSDITQLALYSTLAPND